MSTAARVRTWADALWVIGRRSETAYIRFYPNPGFMLPWFGGQRLLWSRFDGGYMRARDGRQRRNYGRRAKRIAEQMIAFQRGQGV